MNPLLSLLISVLLAAQLSGSLSARKGGSRRRNTSMALEGEVFRYHRRLIRLPDSPEGYAQTTHRRETPSSGAGSRD
jgi:hypothetical protein